MRSRLRLLFILLALTSFAAAQAPATQLPYQSPEAVVGALYDMVTVKAGGPQPDWEGIRGLFYKDALVVLRTSPQATAVFNVQGWIDDFVAFNKRARVGERGFTERIVRMKPVVYKDIAHVWVLYEASLTGSTRPPQLGVDSFQLIKKDGRWWILSVTNDIPGPGGPIPKELEQ